VVKFNPTIPCLTRPYHTPPC